MGRKLTSDSRGWTYRVVQLTSSHHEPVDDKTLVDRVESEIFRDPSIPKGRVNITSRSGVVVLNGELGDESEIKRVEGAVRKVQGVIGVENFMHLPGTPSPNKADARQAGA
jgi:osmotically-inducible protein OsmY